MSNLLLVPANKSHTKDLAYITEKSLAIPWSKTSFEEELENKFARYVVAIYDGKVVGFGGLWAIFDEGHITNIAILPEYRGIGIGNVILSELIALCKKEDIIALTLEVRRSNIVAQKLYEKFGFKVEGIRKEYYLNNKEDAFLMWNRCLSDGYLL